VVTFMVDSMRGEEIEEGGGEGGREGGTYLGIVARGALELPVALLPCHLCVYVCDVS